MTNDPLMTHQGMTKYECRMTKVPVSYAIDREQYRSTLMETKKPVYDLEERTARFGEQVIRFCKTIPFTPITEPLIRQIIKSGTSVGANYCEADDAVSGKEFRQKIGTCKKESRETKHWLRMLAVATEDRAEDARILWREANELMLIFASIFRKLSTKKPKTK